MSAASTPTVELFVRSLSPSTTPATDHVARLQEVENADGVGDTTVTVWGRQVSLADTVEQTDSGRYIRQRVAEFRSWADEHDVSLDPFFETHRVHASVTGEEYAALRLPVTCLAEYEDGELVHVAPYSTGRAVHSVADRLSQLLEERRPDRKLASAPSHVSP